MDQVELVLQTPTESTYINAQLHLILTTITLKFNKNKVKLAFQCLLQRVPLSKCHVLQVWSVNMPMRSIPSMALYKHGAVTRGSCETRVLEGHVLHRK